MNKARLLLLASVAIWGATFIASKICLAVIGPVELVGLRFLIGLPVLLGIIAAKKLPMRVAGPDLKVLAAGGAVMAFHFMLQAYALNYSSATNSAWIIAVAPLAVTLLSVGFLKEKVGGREMSGVAIASAGVLMLISRGDLGSLGWLRSRGEWMILLSAFTWAVYTVITRDLSRSRPPLVVTFYVFLPAMLLGMGAFALNSKASLAPFLSLKPMAALVFLGTLGTAAQWFWQEGVACIGASKAGVYLFLEPVTATLIAIPLLGESFGIAACLGGLMVLAGVWRAETKRSGI